MKKKQIAINIFVLIAIGLLVIQRVFLAITTPWMDFLLIGSSILCLLIGCVIHNVSAGDEKVGISSPNDENQKKPD